MQDDRVPQSVAASSGAFSLDEHLRVTKRRERQMLQDHRLARLADLLAARIAALLRPAPLPADREMIGFSVTLPRTGLEPETTTLAPDQTGPTERSVR